jgi:hypothetical protein
MSVKLFLPVHTTTPGNNRKHWAVEARKTRTERDAACLIVKTCKGKPAFPVKVTLTRLSPRKMDFHNLGGAFKGLIDGIADAYGVDDGDERWRFEFAQRKEKQHGVEILIEPLPDNY